MWPFRISLDASKPFVSDRGLWTVAKRVRPLDWVFVAIPAAVSVWLWLDLRSTDVAWVGLLAGAQMLGGSVLTFLGTREYEVDLGKVRTRAGLFSLQWTREWSLPPDSCVRVKFHRAWSADSTSTYRASVRVGDDRWITIGESRDEDTATAVAAELAKAAGVPMATA
jgi:hypothetical protein